MRVAMTVGEKGMSSGQLLEVVEETQTADEYSRVVLVERRGRIHANLTIGADVASAVPLQANNGISSPGVKLHGAGFILSAEEAMALGHGPLGGNDNLVRPYMNGRDLTAAPRGAYVIDFFGLSEEEARQRAPELYQRLVDHVKHERLTKATGGTKDSQEYAAKWWLFGKPRAELRRAIAGLRRFIATVETAKHRIFIFLDRQILPDNKLICIASDSGDVLGILSSRIHVCWALATGGHLGVGNDPVYIKTRCFDPFPFPACVEAQKQRIRDLGEALDAHRKRQRALHPKLTITGMYNVLEKLRSGEPLNDKEREIHEQGLVSILKQIHDDLDAAVFEAYGWPATLTDDEILERLVALNHERAEEEKRGLVRWLRPEFQNPQGTKAATQVSLVEAGLDTAAPAVATKGKKAKLAWPKDLPARVVAVRDLLAELGEATVGDVSQRFKGVQTDQAEKLLESLAAVGVALETAAGPGARRTWSLVR